MILDILKQVSGLNYNYNNFSLGSGVYLSMYLFIYLLYMYGFDGYYLCKTGWTCILRVPYYGTYPNI